ncbi:hypothetical protein [Mesorhizobium sp. 131-2-1]|uniref:hypothetical protein n=1 Tax=Mesorhizobium sp. 131-2-1 TaxID=2744518 RepID=UPI0019295BBE|nr:hypothetical protein [Mesorhizobium sp. 131-2-1]BCG93044.1 hypothetical protein MesoLj131a_19080 [Mesorhizobium sp. 131-2-1]
MQIVERFQLSGRGLVVICDRPTDFPAGGNLKATIARPDGSKVITTASKEYGYRSEPPHEFEAFVLKGLDLSDVPDGSAVEFGL